jgi:hypothetical protein
MVDVVPGFSELQPVVQGGKLPRRAGLALSVAALGPLGAAVGCLLMIRALRRALQRTDTDRVRDWRREQPLRRCHAFVKRRPFTR